MKLEHAWTVEVVGNRVVVSGDMDLVAPRDLRRAIAAVSGETIELDLSGVVFMDWVGLRLLLDARLDHPSLRIVAMSGLVRDVLSASGTAQYLSALAEHE